MMKKGKGKSVSLSLYFVGDDTLSPHMTFGKAYEIVSEARNLGFKDNTKKTVLSKFYLVRNDREELEEHTAENFQKTRPKARKLKAKES